MITLINKKLIKINNLVTNRLTTANGWRISSKEREFYITSTLKSFNRSSTFRDLIIWRNIGLNTTEVIIFNIKSLKSLKVSLMTRKKGSEQYIWLMGKDTKVISKKMRYQDLELTIGEMEALLVEFGRTIF